MEKDIEILANIAMTNLMLLRCQEHVYTGMMFFSEEEFKENQVEIFKITGARRRLLDKLKKNDRL